MRADDRRYSDRDASAARVGLSGGDELICCGGSATKYQFGAVYQTDSYRGLSVMMCGFEYGNSVLGQRVEGMTIDWPEW